MGIYIIIQVSAEVVRSLQQPGVSTTDTQELFNKAKDLGISLQPMHPGTGDPVLATYFTAEVADSAIAKRIITHLLELKDKPMVFAVFVVAP